MVTLSVPGTVIVLAGAAFLALAVGTVLTMLDRLLDRRHGPSTS